MVKGAGEEGGTDDGGEPGAHRVERGASLNHHELLGLGEGELVLGGRAGRRVAATAALRDVASELEGGSRAEATEEREREVDVARLGRHGASHEVDEGGCMQR